MSVTVSGLTIFFEDPFWVGVYERTAGGCLEVCRVVFGPEPKDYDVYDFFLKNWDSLQFSSPIQQESKETHAISPKRVQRVIRRQLSRTGIGTKAQQALQTQREQNKQARRTVSYRKTEEEKQRQFETKQRRKKEKHRGR